MEETSLSHRGDDKHEIEQQARLEEAKARRIEAEEKKAKRKAREAAQKEFKKKASKIPLKVKLIGLVTLVVVLFVAGGFVLPWVLDDHETHYVSESNLKEAVEIEDLTAVEYVYRGVAEKPGQFLWMDTVEYRVRYEAHIPAYYKLSEIQFSVDNDDMIVTVYLPEAEIGEPVLDDKKFDYLPESASGDMAEVLALCKEDAANEVNTAQIKKEAEDSLRDIVEALTMPMLGGEWSIEFKSLEEFEGGDDVE